MGSVILVIAGLLAYGAFKTWQGSKHQKFHCAMIGLYRFLKHEDARPHIVDQYSCLVEMRDYYLSEYEIERVAEVAKWNWSEIEEFKSKKPRATLNYAECKFKFESYSFKIALEDIYQTPGARGPLRILCSLFVENRQIAKTEGEAIFFVTPTVGSYSDRFHWEDSEKTDFFDMGIKLYFAINDHKDQKLWFKVLESMATRYLKYDQMKMDELRSYIKGA